MALATLSIDLVAKLAELQQGLDQAGRMAEKAADQIKSRFDAAASSAKALGGALAGALSVGILVGEFRALVDGLDKFNDLADATGASVESLSALEDVAKRTGTSVEVAGDAVIKLNKALSGAKPGSDTEAAFTALGLSVEKLKQLDPVEALRQVASALSGFASDGNKARLVQELFGKSLREVAPLLKDLAEAGELNATVTKQQAEEAEKFNKQLFQIAKNSEDAKRAILSELLPAMNAYLETLKRAKADKGSTFFQELTAELLSLRLSVSVSGIETLTDALTKDPGNTGLQKALAAAREEYGRLSRAAADANEKLKATVGIPDPNQGRRPANEGGGGLASRFLPDIFGAKPGKVAAPAAAKEQRFQLDDATKNALRAIESSDVGKANELRATLAKLNEIFQDTPDNPAFVSAVQEINDKLAKLDPVAVAAAEATKRLQDLLQATPTGQLEKLRADAELLTAEMERTTDPERMNRLAEAWVLNINRQREFRGETKATGDQISEFARQAASNIQDALGQTVLDGLKGDFKSIESLWGSMLQRLVAQAISVKLSEAIFGAGFGKTTSDFGGLVGDIVKFFGSNAKASGGPVTAGVPYLVGEQGPEIVVPKQNSTVLPNGVGLGRRGGGTTNVVNISLNGPVPQETVAQIRSEVNRALARFQRNAAIAGAN